jgi:hypothetical protein
MKRLHSHLTYPLVLAPLFIAVFATYSLFNAYDISWRLLVFIAFLNLILFAGFIIPLLDWKRVYLKDSSVYVYDLYSFTPFIFELEQVKQFERDNSPSVTVWGVYKLTFSVDGGYYEISFMKNRFIFNMRKLFIKL